MAVGGFIGSLVAAYLTENYEPRYCFLFSSIMGFVIAAVASRLNVSLETEGLEELLDDQGRPVGFWAELKRNMYEIKEAFKIREYYFIILYLFIGGFLVPNFGSFGYYFMLDVVGISKFTYSMLTVLGYVCLLLGTQVFNKYFKESEYRNLIMAEAFLSIILAPASFIFVLRLNVAWGIPDMAIIIFTETVSEILS